MDELKNFQDALFQIVMQKCRSDHSGIGSYVSDGYSRMAILEDFFKQGLFDLLYKLFTTNGVGSAHNWRNLSSDYHVRCIPLALEAEKKELIDFLFQVECEQLNPKGMFTTDFVNLITMMGQKGFLTDVVTQVLIEKIKSGSLAKDEIISAIHWKQVVNTSGSVGKNVDYHTDVGSNPATFFVKGNSSQEAEGQVLSNNLSNQ